MKNNVVCKFGGTSLANAENIQKVINIIKGDNKKFVVVSAPGKRDKNDTKITDLLINCFNLSKENKDFLISILKQYEQETDEINFSAGKISTKIGNSEISGAEDLKRVHQIRKEVDGIMVGINTVLADNPRLSAYRVSNDKNDNPIRIVVDNKARTPIDYNILKLLLLFQIYVMKIMIVKIMKL